MGWGSGGGRRLDRGGALAIAYAVTVVLALGLALAVAGGCGASSAAEPPPGGAGGAPGASPTGVPPPPPAPATSDPVIAAAGDIACATCKQGETADLLTQLAATRPLGAILMLGDGAYPKGALADYQSFYAPAWGRPELLAITRPVPGGHDYLAPPGDASGYFGYFDAASPRAGAFGVRDHAYYSFDLGAWHLIALDTGIGCERTPCDAQSPQAQWLAADLAAHAGTACTLAFFHEPRFQTGGTHGDASSGADFWRMLYDAGADLVLNGHEHNYQQLGPLDPDGRPDPARGLRSFVVGTGGSFLYKKLTSAHADALETRDDTHHGVLELVLHPSSYDWRFLSTTGEVLASGNAACH